MAGSESDVLTIASESTFLSLNIHSLTRRIFAGYGNVDQTNGFFTRPAIGPSYSGNR